MDKNKSRINLIMLKSFTCNQDQARVLYSILGV